MSFKGYIEAWKVLAAGACGAGVALGLVGILESQYYSPGSFSALIYGFGMYALLGLVWGALYALLLGGKARKSREDLVRMAGRTAAWPAGGLILAAGVFLVYRDLWKESVSQAGFTGWLVMAAVVLAAFGGAIFARQVGRSLSASPLVAPALVLPLALAGMLLSGWIEELPASSVDLGDPKGATRTSCPVILVVPDALRADALGSYGDSPDTPNLDAFARDAVVFKNAWASATWTRPSVASILTGRYPSGHRAIHKTDLLPEDLPTLPGLLKHKGYVTLASVTNVNLAPVFGLDRGFDTYAYFAPRPFLGAPSSARRLFLVEIYRLLRLRLMPGHREPSRYYAEGELIIERGRKLMSEVAGKSVPFFAYLHFMEPHDPYFAHPYDGRAVARVEDPHPDVKRAGEFMDLYRQEVRHLDRLFGELVSYLKEADLYDRALIVVTSDHGEEFADHQGFWHGTTLYQELVHVPLLIRFPGGSGAGTVQAQPVTLVDLLPTVLQSAGVQSPEGLPGRALDPDPRDPDPQRILFAEEDHQGCKMTAVRAGRYKLVRSNPDNPRKIPEIQLFDIESDPKELKDLAGDDPDTVARLESILEKGPDSEAPPGAGQEGVKLDSETEEQLRSLGYTE